MITRLEMEKALGAWIAVCCTLAVLSSQAIGNPVPSKAGGLTIRIVHTNDMHSR